MVFGALGDFKQGVFGHRDVGLPGEVWLWVLVWTGEAFTFMDNDYSNR